MGSDHRSHIMRPSLNLALILLLLLGFDAALFIHSRIRQAEAARHLPSLTAIVTSLGLTDLAVATEARYTRHPAVSDPMAPYGDHPGAIEHFPSGSFWRPPSFR